MLKNFWIKWQQIYVFLVSLLFKKVRVEGGGRHTSSREPLFDFLAMGGGAYSGEGAY